MIRILIFIFYLLIYEIFSQTTTEMPTPPGVYVENVCFCVTAGSCKNGSSNDNENSEGWKLCSYFEGFNCILEIDIEESDGSIDSRSFKFNFGTTTRATTQNFQVSFDQKMYPVSTGLIPGWLWMLDKNIKIVRTFNIFNSSSKSNLVCIGSWALLSWRRI